MLKLFNIGIRNNPEDDEAYYGKAVTLIKLGRQEEALECLDKAIKLNPSIPSYRAYKAILCAEAKDYKQAEEELKAINFDQLSNSNKDKHIKNVIKNIQNKHQKLKNIDTVGNSENLKSKDETEFLWPSKNSITLKGQRTLANRVGILEKENEELKVTVNQLQNSVNKLISLKNYPENVITKESCDSNHLSSNDELVSSLGNNAEHDI